MSIEIVPVHALSTDPVDEKRFEDWIAVRTDSLRAVFGADHAGWSAEELRERRRGRQFAFTDRAALDEGVVAGMLSIAEPQLDNTDTSMAMLYVHPAHRRRGIGARLEQTLRSEVRKHRRHIIQAETQWAAGGHDEGGEHFAAPRGYTAAQSDLRSAMALPADREVLARWADGNDRFEILVSWDGLPATWLADQAVLQQRMSTDMPLDDLALNAEVWDADRVREEIDWALTCGRRLVQAVARDRRSGRLVGFTRVEVSQDAPQIGYQQDTLVLREARGHRLGLRMKARVALELMDHLPHVRQVTTWNAETNQHMLAVNRRLGYATQGSMCTWQKRIS